MKFLLPTGIGDTVWALFKIQSIRDRLDPGGAIDALIACGDDYASNPIESRAVDFVRRFSFIRSVAMQSANIHSSPWHSTDGCYNYLEDGRYDVAGESVCVLIPNAALEHGIRLEDWLPQYSINWEIFADFHLSPTEVAFGDSLHASLGEFACFYPGPLSGNTHNGHNRNGIWKPTDWIQLGRRIHAEYHLPIVVVGASYDAPYYNHLLSPDLNGDGGYWTNLIGHTSIGQLFSVTRHAKFMVSYQAGVGIVSTYLNVPTAIFWRAHGDSISPDVYLTFSEQMASAWVPPSILSAHTHLPLVYGRHDVAYIMEEIKSRGWAERA